jgi:transmembrane sensor
VVGTEFNLSRHAGETRLTVRRGVVEVRPAGSPDAVPLRLVVGQQLLHRDVDLRSSVASVEADNVFACSQGQLVYRDAPLSRVAADLSRRFTRPVHIADPETGKLRFTGVLMMDDEDAVVRRLEAYAPIRARSSDREILLRRIPPHT